MVVEASAVRRPPLPMAHVSSVSPSPSDGVAMERACLEEEGATTGDGRQTRVTGVRSAAMSSKGFR